MLALARFTTIVLSALALGLGLAHALITPTGIADVRVAAGDSAAGQPMLMSLAAGLQVGAACAALLLTMMLRRRQGFGLALAGTFCMAVAAMLWALTRGPLDPSWLTALETSVLGWAATSVRRVLQWQHLDLMALSTWLLAFSLLVLSVVRQPLERSSELLPLMPAALRRT
jgi:hypothetical protein